MNAKRQPNHDTPTDGEPGYDAVAAVASRLQDAGSEVTLDAVREALGDAPAAVVFKHLAAWRAEHVKQPELPRPELPEAVVNGLVDWVRQFADQASAGVRDSLAQSASDTEALLRASDSLGAERDALRLERDRALATSADQAEEIERLNAELRNARQIATEALVSKAKDQLAIDGKDKQLAELRAQLERNVTAQAEESDRRLAAEMELVGATTERDSLAAELKEVRRQLETSYAERSNLRAELEVLRSKR
ncbi:DNA-binding protein [Massilia sp. KIM]|uniref:DNA-binding protein n=1 Tax=Massilia sp. KIM TaxID=1955422 RepID=UPI00098F21FD|nr:DNA-binding protein [Massilia sp. KIM]